MSRAFKAKTNVSGHAIIRKVFSGNHFTCGICRGHFDHYDDAFDCVETCWDNAVKSYPLTVYYKHNVGNVFRCRFCMREYHSEEEGIHCADMCKHHVEETAKFGLKVLKDLKGQTIRGDASRKRIQRVAVQTKSVSRFQLRSKGPQSAQPLSNDSEVQTPTAEVMTPAAKESGDVNLPAAKASKGDTKADNRKSKSDFPKPWYRNGAKYVCSYCNTEVYTKSEVDTCFNGHFDQNDKEKNPSS